MTDPEQDKPAEEPNVLGHEYDGIQEYDNPLPRWWVWTFWASTVFAVGYFFHYHVSHNGTSVAAEYDAEMQVAHALEAKRSLAERVSEGSLSKLAADAQSMSEAKALFGQRCSPCHAAEGQGLIGPNLTDSFWIHGKGAPMDVYDVVDQGVTAKGMPAWGKQLSAVELRKVVAFVTTLRGKNVAGKAAEGNRVD
ncbi:MAG: cbb3-type cytochrome c oxidase N-terminal domain-containing protein [Polyangiaceae bacterium]